MQILFLLGNGFDLNLGMKTRYKDFYCHYLSVESKKEYVNKFKKHLSENLDNWSDLELSLGEYTQNIKTLEEFDDVFEDIAEKLADFLLEQENNFDFSKILKEELHKCLIYPEQYLLNSDRNQLSEYKDRWSKNRWYVHIITFNYTRTLERILGEEISNIKIGTHHDLAHVSLQGIDHLHGFVDERMIMGVNDKSQVKNVQFHENPDVLEAIIKIQCNKAQKHNVDDACIKRITTANLICIFGSSIGETDNYWWELIGNQLLVRDCHLIIFYKCEDISPRFAYKKARKEREIKNIFLSKTKLDENEKKLVESKIFVGINTNLFKLNNS
ncbi:bacteriophage abortive infection AbiH family protein [Pontibacter sp. BT310]|uniref:Bacteriophage abortive infection AbiH family protein n=1 Tax=Pontibacter populi TaxID=890055 RepID=A0ABS6X938_9BACT|nr:MULTISPECIES: AbiH family protein [Pontibacter]MBJ6117649.1 bacteriophage abortive infection AbiH family protein [Pontibacter sp. BT310]MBR0570075.1 bacteriophage abortive infection AbiH family protein [Microvirga sp. STS03]MBW3364501.1 bacteriophage abortive infection AbiH family protein [Pontibacter populi]